MELFVIQYVVLIVLLVWCAVSDIRSYTIPNAALVLGIVVRIVFMVAGLATAAECATADGCATAAECTTAAGSATAAGWGTILESICAAVVCSALPCGVALVLERRERRAKQEAPQDRCALGGGDVKLLFMASLYFGIWMATLCLFLSCLVGALIGIFLRGKPIPFGVAIALAYTGGAVVCMLGL